MIPLLTFTLGALATSGGYTLMLVRKQGQLETRMDHVEKACVELDQDATARIIKMTDLVETVIQQNTKLIAELQADRHSRRNGK